MYRTGPFDHDSWGDEPRVSPRAPHDRAAFRAEVRFLLRALAAHDRDTAVHSLRVWRYAMWLADEFRLGRRERVQLSLAARLHDIGKLCIPREILNKPGALSEAEYGRVQDHSALGARVLRALTPCPVVQGAVRWHHERVDGTGYPDGLRGAEIPFPARLVAVADAFDAMTSARPYGQPLPWLKALDVLRHEAGRQFDATVVDRFAAALRRSTRRPGACGTRRRVRACIA